ncbi:MAG: hypothetical protein GY714_30195 [Desulfobacterales bacterium]|nr:hypothetical protein [Desulfobacterales bacterium]
MKVTKLIKKFNVIALLITIVTIFGCSGEIVDPLIKIKMDLKKASTYSIVLEDMKEEGTFSSKYFHKYRIIEETNGKATDWLQVTKGTYQKNVNFLGMSIFAKKDGKFVEGVNPAGYQYVGDPKYGKWTNRGGSSFWEFYGQYAMLRTLFGGWYSPIGFNDYDYYKRYRRNNRSPFYGKNKRYGTFGKLAKKAKPSFFTRNSSSFRNKFSSRIGRSNSGFRGRSGGRGK